jgi:hypothetical protein
LLEHPFLPSLQQLLLVLWWDLIEHQLIGITIILGQSNFNFIQVTTEDPFVIIIIFIFIFFLS